jgi:hypothetical protein
MNASTQGNDLNINLNHGVNQINNVIGYPTKVWRATRRYSVNNTISVAMAIATLAAGITFFIQPVTVGAFGFVFMPTPLFFIPFAVLLLSIAIKIINTQRIKETEIDVKIASYQEDEQYSTIAQEAQRIEIITNLDGSKKELSITLPIARTQREILEDIEEENRNKIILFAASYAFSAIVVASGLVQSINPPVALAIMLLAIVLCSLITLYKLRSNKIDHDNHTIKRFSVLDVLLPFRSGTVVSVMGKKAKDQEENDPMSQLLKIAREFKDEVVDLLNGKLDKACNSFDTFLDETKASIDKLLDSADANIEKTLNSIGKDIKETLEHLKGIREDIKKDLDELHVEISAVLSDAKQITGKVNSLDIQDTFSKVQNSIKIFDDAIKAIKDKMERLKFGRLCFPYFDEAQPNQDGRESGNNQAEDDDEHFQNAPGWELEINMLKKASEELKESMKNAFAGLKKSLEELKNKQPQSNEPERAMGSNGSLDVQQDEEAKLRKELEDLEKQQRIEKLKEKKEKLEQKRIELPEQKEWKEKINGPASEFFNYVLKTIKLKTKDANGEEVDATLRNFDVRIITHWKDGSQTTCDISKDGNFQVQPNTKVDFVDQKIQAGLVACAG